MSRQKLFAALMALPIVFFLLVSGAAWLLGSSNRIDLTQNKLYTLAPGTQAILRSLQGPVDIKIYFSDEATEELPDIRFFAQRVEDLITEMQLSAQGQLTVSWIDPVPFSEAEDEALLAELSGLPIGPQNSTVYLGAQITGTEGRSVTIPIFSPQREALLEYELIQAIEQVQRAEVPRLGVITDLPIQSWFIYQELMGRYELVEIPTTATLWPSQLDGIMIIQPTFLSPELTEHIIEHINGQGPVLLLVDPLIQSIQATPTPASGLSDVLSALSMEMSYEAFVADGRLALEVILDSASRSARHPAILGLGPSQLSASDVVTSQLEAINAATVGRLSEVVNDSVSFEVLWQSSEQSKMLPVTRVQANLSPEEMVNALMSELAGLGEPQVMAARVSGAVNAIVVADVDFLDDRYWVSRQNFLGAELMDRFASNGAFVLNALDHLLGDPRLVDIRSRDVAYRPFTLVDELRREAQARLLATEQRLSAALAEANQALEALQIDSPEDMSEAQREEVQSYVKRRLELRQELRQLRRALDEDIQALEQRVVWLNLLLVPLLIVFWLTGRHIYRRIKARDPTRF